MKPDRRAQAALVLVLTCGTALAQTGGTGPEPRRPTYPEGVAVPRSMTDAERAWVAKHPITAPIDRAATSPVGPVHCVAEYEPMESILFAWEGDSSQINIQKAMIEQITNVGDADVWIAVDSTSERSSVISTLAATGANTARIKYVVRATDSIWIRDYGPRYIYEGDCRAIVDHTYNRPRPSDDAFNTYYGNTTRRQRVYALPLVHGGGNYHLDASDHGNATRLIANENPSLSDAQIKGLWQTYQNVDTTLHTPFPTSVDSTQHIDMWMQIIGDNKIVISDWPAQPGTTQDVICDTAAASFASGGWTVYRTPARTVSGVHYTYTNVVMCNDLVLIPTYTSSTIVSAGYNASSLATWQAAMPGKTIVQVNCQGIVSFAGVMHCIVMHIPEHRGGVNPTAYIQNPQGGESFDPSDSVSIEWISDDDVLPVLADIALSTDGGATFPTAIATATTDDGQFTWTVPSVNTGNAKLRVTIRDASGNTGSYVTPAFTIGTPPCAADYNGTGDQGDVLDFLDFMDDFGACENLPGPCGSIGNADFNGDTVVDVLDFLDFIDAFGTGC